MAEQVSVIEKVRRSLGRTAPLASAPTPPAIDEPIVRLVHTEFGLPELFAKRAGELKMLVSLVYPEELAKQLVEFLRGQGVKRIAMPESKLLDQLELPAALRAAGFEVKQWGEMTLDEMYDFDAAVTDVDYAVAESGSLVIKTDREHGRAMTLTPLVHVAVLEPKNFVPDLVDLFERLAREGPGQYVVMISGPSKTADIEMNLVTGVHGPKVVQAFVLQ
jgi:L-lactate dehydrogenase complex protein LldG